MSRPRAHRSASRVALRADDPDTVDAIAPRMESWRNITLNLHGESVEIERAVAYTFHTRMAARWRRGRVLLAIRDVEDSLTDLHHLTRQLGH